MLTTFVEAIQNFFVLVLPHDTLTQRTNDSYLDRQYYRYPCLIVLKIKSLLYFSQGFVLANCDSFSTCHSPKQIQNGIIKSIILMDLQFANRQWLNVWWHCSKLMLALRFGQSNNLASDCNLQIFHNFLIMVTVNKGRCFHELVGLEIIIIPILLWKFLWKM